jgi:hypothetical protein
MEDDIGTVEERLFPQFLQTFDDMWQLAIKRYGTERNAGMNEQGHQKTPAFVHTIVGDLLVATRTGNKDLASKPEGGTTDVGQHTGSKPRSTCFALVSAVLEDILTRSWKRLTSKSLNINKDGHLYTRILGNFYLWLLERQLQTSLPQGSTNTAAGNPLLLPVKTIDVISGMMDKVCTTCITLTEDRVGVADFLTRLVAARNRLSFANQGIADKYAEAYALHPISLLRIYPSNVARDIVDSGDSMESLAAKEMVHWRHFLISLPPVLTTSKDNLATLDELRTSAGSNLKGILATSPPIDSATFSEAISWMATCSTAGGNATSALLERQLLVIDWVEMFLIHKMERLSSSPEANGEH